MTSKCVCTRKCRLYMIYKFLHASDWSSSCRKIAVIYDKTSGYRLSTGSRTFHSRDFRYFNRPNICIYVKKEIYWILIKLFLFISGFLVFVIIIWKTCATRTIHDGRLHVCGYSYTTTDHGWDVRHPTL